MSTLFQDIRFGARLLLKDRTFTITALLTLAICLGANAAMFTVVRSVLLKPLPFPGLRPRRAPLQQLSERGRAARGRGGAGLLRPADGRARAGRAGALPPRGHDLGDESGAERLVSIRATPSFFRVVRVEPILGRVFTDDEGRGREESEGAVELCVLEAQVRRSGHDRRPQDSPQRQRVRRRRRAAGGVHVPAERHRPVRARCLCAGRQCRRPSAQQQLADDRPVARRRHDRSGAAAGRGAQRLERRAVPGVSPDSQGRATFTPSRSFSATTWCATCATSCFCCGAASGSCWSSAASTSRTSSSCAPAAGRARWRRAMPSAATWRGSRGSS